jgi:hypothetical protein
LKPGAILKHGKGTRKRGGKMAKKYPELTKEIDLALEKFVENNPVGLSFGHEFDPWFEAFNDDCATHLICHAISTLTQSECAALRTAFVFGVIVASRRKEKRDEIKALFDLYKKEGNDEPTT